MFIHNSLSADKNISEVKQAADLEKEVKKNIEASIDYQIIKKTLFKKQTSDEDNNHNSKTDKLAEKDEYSIVETTDIVTISEQAASLSRSDSSTNMNQTDVNMTFESREQASLSFSRSIDEEEIEQSDPLALDLNGDGLQTTGVNNGVNFDINGDGIKEKTSFVSGGDAFLAYDKNGNGTIDGAKELFGDSNGYQHGFAELAAYDDNQDGKIDSSDAIYDQLKLFTMDENSHQQLAGLSDADIASINVTYNNHNQAINQYDTIAQIGQFEYKNGQKGLAGDLLLGHLKS